MEERKTEEKEERHFRTSPSSCFFFFVYCLLSSLIRSQWFQVRLWISILLSNVKWKRRFLPKDESFRTRTLPNGGVFLLRHFVQTNSEQCCRCWLYVKRRLAVVWHTISSSSAPWKTSPETKKSLLTQNIVMAIFIFVCLMFGVFQEGHVRILP